MKIHQPIRKAVFPIAGFGTRMLPATKSMPKEMLTIVDKPVIQLAVEEARDAGIEHFIFVTGRNKSIVEDHFDQSYELEQTLARANKNTQLALLGAARIPAGKASFVRQQEALGLGHAVLCARDLVGHEPFAVILPDMVMKSEQGCLSQMVETYDSTGGNLIASQTMPEDQLNRYGVLDLAGEFSKAQRIKGMIEKPQHGTAPSDQIVSGRYILQPQIFEMLANTPPGAGGEIQLTDAMKMLLEEEPFRAFRYDGQTFDCGNPLGYVLANIAFGLDRSDLSDLLVGEVSSLISSLGKSASLLNQNQGQSRAA